MRLPFTLKQLFISCLVFFVLCFLFLKFYQQPKRWRNFERGFYTWGGYYSESDLDTLKVQKVYQKFFEVGLNNVLEPVPIDELGSFGIISNYRPDAPDNRAPFLKEFVPVVYIQNTVLLQKDFNAADLAHKVWHLLGLNLDGLDNDGFDLQVHEFQIDCDWTPRTRKNYFSFLVAFKKELRASAHFGGCQLSATLRLYPYKYPNKMGFLPNEVDRAMLMCYNLSAPDHTGQRNSIFSLEVLKAYLQNTEPYPTDLDIALPVYSMAYVYQDQQLVKLLRNTDSTFNSSLQPVDGLWYAVPKDTVIDEFYMRKGQRVKLETIHYSDLKSALQIINEEVLFRMRPTLSFFSLESIYDNKSISAAEFARLYRGSQH
jgi:hypothetical protein